MSFQLSFKMTFEITEFYRVVEIIPLQMCESVSEKSELRERLIM